MEPIEFINSMERYWRNVTEWSVSFESTAVNVEKTPMGPA
jgi:hypothetical protein